MTNSLDHKVLACVDLSPYAQHVADHAAWAAARLGCTLELLHVIERHPDLASKQDRSGALDANAHEKLLHELSAEDEARTRAEREHARVFLNRLRERALAAGVAQVDTRQRHGDLEQTLREQEGVRLFVLGRRGASATQTRRDLGRHVEWVVRALERPILTVHEGFRVPARVLIAFDGRAITRQGVEMVATSPLFRGLQVHVLMAGKPGGDAPRQVAWAHARLEQAGFEVRSDIVPGDPETVVGATVAERDIDMLVMGAYTHAPWRALFTGSKTTDLLRAARVATLLLR